MRWQRRRPGCDQRSEFCSGDIDEQETPSNFNDRCDHDEGTRHLDHHAANDHAANNQGANGNSRPADPCADDGVSSDIALGCGHIPGSEWR